MGLHETCLHNVGLYFRILQTELVKAPVHVRLHRRRPGIGTQFEVARLCRTGMIWRLKLSAPTVAAGRHSSLITPKISDYGRVQCP